MPFLADPTQEPAYSWLQSPAVAFIGLVSGVISIVQAVMAVRQWVSEKATKEGARRRFSFYFATVCVAASAIMAPLTWTAIVRADIETHDPYWISQLYPVIPVLMVVAGVAWIAGYDLPAKRRPSLVATAQIALGLFSPVLACYMSSASAWERSCVDVLPALATLFLIPLFLSYAKSMGQPEHKDSTAPASS
jgi:cytochrome bd-type quinol oxidase subunit 2